MKLLNRTQHQRGVGLIEVLVTLVVIAVGVIAVLGLQGTLMSGSAATKARNEALTLAREKTEALRNAIERDQFDTELAAQDGQVYDPDYKDGIKVGDGSGNGKINGVNTQFTRRWEIVDVASVEGTRELIMRVTWVDAQGADNQVELNTLIAYASPLASILSAATDGGVRPGSADTGYEGLHGATPKTGGTDDRPDGEIKDLDDHFGITQILRYSDSAHVQVRIWDELCSEVDIVRDPDGNPIINEEDEYLCVVFTAFGGTLLRFGGALYTDYEEEILVKATSPAYCAHQELESACEGIEKKQGKNMYCAEYLCYASGDCSIRDGDGDDTATGGGGDCPTGTAAELEALNLPDLNGGWYGKIGYYFPGNEKPPTVCMGMYETVDDDGNPILDDDGNPVWAENRKAARLYYSERTVENPETGEYQDWREGINQPFLGHKTLILDTTAEPDRVCDDEKGYERLVAVGTVWNSFVGPKVIRDVTGVDNIVQDTDETYEDVVAIYGDIEFPKHPPIKANEELKKSGSSTFESVETESTGEYAEDVDGKCDFPKDGNIYACNYVNTQWADGWSWSGSISAKGTMDFTITNLDNGQSRVCDDCLCTVTNYYASQSPGRYSEEDIPEENPDSVISCATN